MEPGSSLRVDDAFVIHVLDNRTSQAECSEALTPLPENLRTALEGYLSGLLRLRFRRRRFGRFRPGSPVLQAYRRLLERPQEDGRVDPAVFLEVSQRLAALLFETMRQESRHGAGFLPGGISPGDLLVGLCYSQAPEASQVPSLFLIKVELESGLQRQLRTLPQGGMQTLLTPCEGLLPKLTGGTVHKTALIRWADDATTYDVLMADPQGGKQRVAKFFGQDFLQVEPFRTPDQQAELLFERTRTWVTQHQDDLTPGEQQDVLQSIRSTMSQCIEQDEPLALHDLIVALPLSEPRVEPVVNELRRSFQDALSAPESNGDSIPVDRELFVRTMPPQAVKSRVTFQLDYGVQLVGEPEAIEQLFAESPHNVAGHTEFTIRTETFRPIF